MHTVRSYFFRTICSLGLLFLAAGCSPFGSSAVGGGVAQTGNGGLDWQTGNFAVLPASNSKKKPKPTVSPLASAHVLDLVFDAKNSKHIYAGTRTNGLFYSEDGGAQWKQILSSFTVYDVAIEPQNSDVLFVAGQADGRSRVLKSSNKGGSWEEVFTDATTAGGARAVVFDPRNPQRLLVGLASGNAVLSGDGGKTWALLQNFQDQIMDIVWHTSGQLLILTKSKGLYISADDGKTVRALSASLLSSDTWKRPGSFISDGSRTEVAPIDVPPDQTSSFYHFTLVGNDLNYIYLAANNGLFRTRNQGGSWEYQKLPLRVGQATDVRAVATAGSPVVIYASVGNTVFQSANEGVSWQVRAIATPATINYILIDPQDTARAYAGLIGLSQ